MSSSSSASELITARNIVPVHLHLRSEDLVDLISLVLRLTVGTSIIDGWDEKVELKTSLSTESSIDKINEAVNNHLKSINLQRKKIGAGKVPAVIKCKGNTPV
jgi:hypothetical protein